jgi:putative colanic acid biosynthesis UDP-glucose lipid carrier transferase
MRKPALTGTTIFYNVMLGDMSVVGLDHILWSSKSYASRWKKVYGALRLNQELRTRSVKNFRGEVRGDDDMISRIKFDVFYIEGGHSNECRNHYQRLLIFF